MLRCLRIRTNINIRKKSAVMRANSHELCANNRRDLTDCLSFANVYDYAPIRVRDRLQIYTQL